MNCLAPTQAEIRLRLLEEQRDEDDQNIGLIGWLSTGLSIQVTQSVVFFPPVILGNY